MSTTFVNKKSELTIKKEAHEALGLEVLRSRLHCNCKPCQNRRYGILIINNETVVARVILCKQCAKGGMI